MIEHRKSIGEGKALQLREPGSWGKEKGQRGGTTWGWNTKKPGSKKQGNNRNGSLRLKRTKWCWGKHLAHRPRAYYRNGHENSRWLAHTGGAKPADTYYSKRVRKQAPKKKKFREAQIGPTGRVPAVRVDLNKRGNQGARASHLKPGTRDDLQTKKKKKKTKDSRKVKRVKGEKGWGSPKNNIWV